MCVQFKHHHHHHHPD
ncbi:his operon leader peptide [Pseudocitrobacter sp. RIT415]|nr:MULTISPECIES: his operon leader peptide [Pseudocitrobacter]MDF3828176.1 his operon leader peptide [Pseudocitrobacter sp. 2023EL-00150]MEB4673321.1 his operon leader peptide [Enterobacteriaceae bacterium G50]MEC5374331.1 his operon leader peptide [Pseudocitrobacter sp. MW920760]RAU46808.1 his operon leader peptide [Pseudocitrobacter sp. RIT 415]